VRFEHGSILGGKTCAAWVSSQWKSTFIAQMVWEKGRKNDAKLLSVGHEYILVYARSLAALKEAKTVWREEKPGAREIWDEYIRLRRAHGDDEKTFKEVEPI
jgi:adenine-specific DNA-methyltransferase